MIFICIRTFFNYFTAGFFPHKTIQPVTNLSVVAEHPSISSTSIDVPLVSDFPIYCDATTEMPVIKSSANRVTFNSQPTVLTDRLPSKLLAHAEAAATSISHAPTIAQDMPTERCLLERSTVAKPTNVSLPVFEMGDDRTETIPVHQPYAAHSIFEVSKAAPPSLPVPDMSIASLSLMSFRDRNTGQLPVINAATIDKMVVQPFSGQKPTHVAEPANKIQPTLEHSMATMSFFQDHTTGKLPCINFDKQFNVADVKPVETAKPFCISEQMTLKKPFEISEPTTIKKTFEISEPTTLQKPFQISEPTTLNNPPAIFDASIASMSSLSLLQEMPSTSSRQPVVKFANQTASGLASILKDPPSVQKRNNFDDEFLDMFTKTPEKNLPMPAKNANGSSSKKGASRIPIPSSLVKSAVKSFAGMSQFEQASIHIKSEPLDEITPSTGNHVSFDISSFEMMSSSDSYHPGETHQAARADVPPMTVSVDHNQSVHYKKPLSAFTAKDYETWSELSVLTPSDELAYVEPIVDMNETRNVIESHLDNVKVNPFDEDVKAAFLDQCYFVDYMKSLDTCVMVNKLSPIYPKSRLDIGDRTFDVLALIGQGNFGHIFR